MTLQDQEFVPALYRRVRLAVDAAEQIVARSRVLTSMRQVLGDHALSRRCAWCGRLSLGGAWVPAEELPAFLPGATIERATHTICLCPECETRLVQEGKSHARSGA